MHVVEKFYFKIISLASLKTREKIRFKGAKKSQSKENRGPHPCCYCLEFFMTTQASTVLVGVHAQREMCSSAIAN